METAQEREVQLLQGRQAWPFHHMMGMGMAATATGAGYGAGGIGGDCGFVLGWEQPPAPAPFGCFGLLAADVHDLFPLFAGMESALPVSSSSALAAPPPPPPASAHDAIAAIPGELDDLLLNFWDASCHDGDVGEQQKPQLDAFNSTCVTHEQTTTTTTTTCAAAAATTTNSFFHYDDGDDPLSSIFCTGPTPPLLPAEKAVAFQQHAPAAEPEPLLSSSSSNCRQGAQPQPQGAAATPTTPPPLPRSSTPSRKRATREAGSSSSEQAAAECSQESESSKRRRTEAAAAPAPASSARVLCPFALLKPDGLDGGATLADINARILMRPSRPVRHPVGEFACAPRVSADQPGLSGKAVSSFTRLHTPGRGTITIIRTRG
ncbi:unnamed protein product [Urochloa decumbens]|uniref:Uncharacterized protein n=1 Tax=Urochloa decumbens TaxID=240449 RepID=A0ABC9FGG8_9POAL